MSIAVCSMFRDNASTGSFPRYFNQLRNQTYQDFRLSWLEGDSTDDTFEELLIQRKEFSGKKVSLIKHDSGLPYHGSVELDVRFKLFADNCNNTISLIQDDVDYIMWLESDLIIPNNYLERMLRHFDNPDISIIAPNIVQELPHDKHHFYDTWAFRPLDGSKWHNQNPIVSNASLLEVAAVGSSWIYRADIFRQGIRHTNKETCVGFCRQARERGYRVFVDLKTELWHPSQGVKNSRWIG